MVITNTHCWSANAGGAGVQGCQVKQKVFSARLGQDGLGWVMLGQIRLGQEQVRLSQVRLGYAKLSQVRLGQVRLSQVKLGQVGLGQVWVRLGLDQVRFGLHNNVIITIKKMSTKIHKKCPRKVTLFVYENLPFISSRSQPSKKIIQFAKRSSTSMPFHYRGYLFPLPSYSFARKIDSPCCLA